MTLNDFRTEGDSALHRSEGPCGDMLVDADSIWLHAVHGRSDVDADVPAGDGHPSTSTGYWTPEAADGQMDPLRRWKAAWCSTS